MHFVVNEDYGECMKQTSMREVIALVLAGGRVDELSVLTMNRAKAALPFGGLYRIIDFPLSNLMHSGIERVGILSQYRPLSLMNHIGDGAAWDMIGRNRSIHILPPYQGYNPSDWYRGNADAVYQNLDYIRSLRPKLALVLSGDHIYKMNYRKLVRFHQEMEADLTVAFKEVPYSQASRFGLGVFSEADESGGRLAEYAEKPIEPISQWASLTIYLFRPEVLYEVAETLIAGQQKYEFGRDIIPELLHDYRVFGYKFDGYWGYTRTIDEFYNTNMSLLGDQPEVDPDAWMVRTNLAHGRIQDRAPSIIGEAARVKNSLFYNGCKIWGTVDNSIIFPGVTISAGSVVRDSIVMFNSYIGPEAMVDAAIIDTDVRVEAHAKIGCIGPRSGPKGYRQRDKEHLTLIGHNARIAARTEVDPGTHVFPNTEHAVSTGAEFKAEEVVA